MKTKKQNTRRSFMNTLFKGAALGTAAGMLLPNKVKANTTENSMANVYAMWTHGSEGKIVGPFHDGLDSYSAIEKLTNIPGALVTGFRKVNFNTSAGEVGTTILLGGEAAATMVPSSRGSLFTIWDKGSKNNAKNGEFWVHYTIPTPAIANSVRVKVSKILVKCASSDANFYISDVELWDANVRLYNKGNLKLWGPDKMHGFSFAGSNNTVRYGLCVSLKIKGQRVSADRILEVSGVGVDLIA